MSLFTEKNPDCEPCEYKSNLEVMRSIPCFSAIQVDQLKIIAYLSERLNYKEGEYLFEQDEKGDSAYYVLSGRIRVTRTRKGEELVLGELEPGNFAGGLTLLSPSRRVFSLQAAGNVSCMVFRHDRVLPRLAKDPHVFQVFAQSLADEVVKWEETSLLNRGDGKLDLDNAGVSLL